MTHGLLTPPGHVTKCHGVDRNLGAKEVTLSCTVKVSTNLGHREAGDVG
jgi:hypothetical protein